MSDLLSYDTFIDFPPISDYKPLLIKGKCFSLVNSDNSFSLPKKTVKWDRLKCINEKESIIDYNYLGVLEEVVPDPNISIDDISLKFISTSFNISKEFNITSMSEVRKFFFSYVTKLFNLQKLKMKLHKVIKRRGTIII